MVILLGIDHGRPTGCLTAMDKGQILNIISRDEPEVEQLVSRHTEWTQGIYHLGNLGSKQLWLLIE